MSEQKATVLMTGGPESSKYLVPRPEETEEALAIALAKIGAEIHANKIAHGWKITTQDDWKDQHEVPAVLMLVVTEVAEAMEAFRVDDKDNFAEELADVVIRTIGLAHGLGINLSGAILAKMEKNRARAYRHGGKRL